MENYIKQIIASVKPLPARLQKIGNCHVAWWEGQPGDAIIMASGGSGEDKIFAENVVESQLTGFGYKRATFYFSEVDPTEILDRGKSRIDYEREDDNLNRRQKERVIERQDNWNNIVEKSKRLIQSGNVTLVRNTNQYVFGNVIGDHGAYQCEIMRKNPDAPMITGWTCTCPWNQYAHGRSRQWKIYEGRPCSHVLAMYYLSKLSPSEEGEPPPEQGPSGAPPIAPGAPAPVGEPSLFAAPQGDAMPGGEVPSVPRGPRGIEQMTPMTPEGMSDIDPEQILEQRLGPLAPVRQYMPEREERLIMSPESERTQRQFERSVEKNFRLPNKIQRPPLEILKERQRLEMPPSAPGTAPYGQTAPRNTVSVPGTRGPDYNNPMNLPGIPGFGAYSKVTTKTPVLAMTNSQSYKNIPAGSKCLLISQDPATNLIEVEFKFSKSGSVRCYLTGEELNLPST